MGRATHDMRDLRTLPIPAKLGVAPVVVLGPARDRHAQAIEAVQLVIHRHAKEALIRAQAQEPQIARVHGSVLCVRVGRVERVVARVL